MQKSWLDTILLLTALQAFVLITVLFQKKQKSIFLIVLLILMGLICLLKANDDLQFYLNNPHLLRIHWGVVMLIAPLTFLHFNSMVNASNFQWKEDGWHLGVFAVNIFVMLPFWMLDSEQKLVTLDLVSILPQTGFGFYKTYYSLFHVAAGLQCIFYANSIHNLILQNETKIKNQFSEISKYALGWGKVSVIGLVIFGLIFCGVAIINFNKQWLTVDFEQWLMLGLFLGVYHISYRTFQQPAIILNKPDIEKNPVTLSAKHPISSEEKSKLNQLGEQLIELLEGEKVYLNAELTQPELAAKMGITRHELSKVLNDILNKSFYDLINEYRVKECQKLMADPKYAHYTLLAIALEAGFSSKTTFNTFFKKTTGQTPSQFKKSLG